MSAEQRRKDIEFLADWARNNSPTVPINLQYGGMEGCSALEPKYSELVQQAKNNQEFIQVVFGYFNRIGELGHGYLYPKENLQGLMMESFATGGKGMIHLPWYEFPRAMYWSDTLEDGFVHPPFRIVRKGPAYFSGESWTRWFRTIPGNSQIVKINGMTCPAFLNHVKENTWLRLVAGNTDWIDSQLLIVPEGRNFSGWDIEFVLPDESRRTEFVPAAKGRASRRMTEFLDWNQGNCICVQLSETVGYIRIKAMIHSLRESDETRIRNFLRHSQGRYDKLIVDVRGNGGGSTFYVYDTLIRPFLRDSAEYRQISGVRRKYRVGITRADEERLRAGISNWAWETKVESTAPPQGFDLEEWIFYQIVREVKPSNRYDFDGHLYILTDRRSGSATETFADAVKRIGLGTLAGQRTAGALGNYFMADTLRLPASGIIVRLEADLDINPDGSIQEVVGTKPDMELAPCELPEKTTKEQLLQDPWIQKVMDEK